MPSFITTDYRLEITPAQPTAIARGQRVAIRLMRRDSIENLREDIELDDDEAFRFDIEEAASGYRVWLELALREAAARGRILAHILYRGIDCLKLELIDGLDVALDDVREIIRATLRHLRDPRSAPPPDEDIELVTEGSSQEIVRHPEEPDKRIFDRPRPRVYLVDEPEQRLHPLLQRRAARWLTSLMSEWGSQCVLATHSLAFIGPSSRGYAYQLTRTDEPDTAVIAPFDPGLLTPYADIAQTLGIDRGELLTRWRAFVFADPLIALILDEIAGDQLSQSAIRVIPLPPPGKPAPPEIAFLADLTAAPIILLLGGDDVADHSDTPSPSHPSGEGAHIQTQPAAVRDLVAQLELDIETLWIPIRHPIDLLHPDAFRRHARPGAATFPGHDRAHSLHDASNQQTPLPYTDFLDARYGITADAPSLQAVARSMSRDRLAVAPQLTDALADIERTILAAETPRPPRSADRHQ